MNKKYFESNPSPKRPKNLCDIFRAGFGIIRPLKIIVGEFRGEL